MISSLAFSSHSVFCLFFESRLVLLRTTNGRPYNVAYEFAAEERGMTEKQADISGAKGSASKPCRAAREQKNDATLSGYPDRVAFVSN